MSNIPERTCIVCRKKAGKENFLKVVKTKDGGFAVQREKKIDGRGAYICKDSECLAKCQKTKALNRVFKTNVPTEIYEDILNG